MPLCRVVELSCDFFVYTPYDLYNLNVTDKMLEFEDTIPYIAANNMTGVICTLQRTVQSTDPNPLVNTVSVEAIENEGVRSTATTQATPVISERWINITKTGPIRSHRRPHKIQHNHRKRSRSSNLSRECNGRNAWIQLKRQPVTLRKNMFNITYVIPFNGSDPLVNTVTAYAEINQRTLSLKMMLRRHPAS